LLELFWANESIDPRAKAKIIVNESMRLR
jgi:hypothetical protein